MKFRSLFIVVFFAPGSATAQIVCSDQNILGSWKECGAIKSPTYMHAPAVINADSLKEAFKTYSGTAGKTWNFKADGTYSYDVTSTAIKGKGSFRVVEDGCALKLSSGKRNPIRIVYLEDSCMILWHNNPITAYLTVYRR